MGIGVQNLSMIRTKVVHFMVVGKGGMRMHELFVKLSRSELAVFGRSFNKATPRLIASNSRLWKGCPGMAFHFSSHRQIQWKYKFLRRSDLVYHFRIMRSIASAKSSKCLETCLLTS